MLLAFTGEDVLFQLKIRGASEKFKNQPRPLLRPRSINFRQHFRNLSHKTVPLRQPLQKGGKGDTQIFYFMTQNPGISSN
jgi:hypothetical protein